ncbi:diguanylate cyclase domain-containing protein [Larsenimonas rhizosphaerae]|uniref:Diguanylate cyclase n=1 Tax=Larsenimonas rhizosphaerae TaxID=2944682 RepID=A0AA42CU14_9GAMM|nr:diguanylate cyclase [Larsenimonas rhizosphaerae]MCX2524167.1 diguanylate cyclase [Larsenimonas rhizosphaerae]
MIHDPDALRPREAVLQHLLDGITEFIVLKDGKGRWLVANQAVVNTYGLQDLDFLGKTDLELLALRPEHESAYRYNIKTDEQAWAHGSALTVYKQFEINGRMNTWEVVKLPRFTPDGARDQLLIVSRNITDRVEAEAALRDNEQKYRLIAENMTDIIGTRNARGILTYLSPSLEYQLGHRPEDYVGRQPGRLIHPDDMLILQQTSPTDIGCLDVHTRPVRCRLKNSAGEYRWFEITRALTREQNTSSYQVVFACRDIHERVHYEQQLQDMAYRDPLTGVANRRQLLDSLQDLINTTPARLAVLYLDVDHFKGINDHFGHDIGDELLISLAHRLGQQTGGNDLVARIGGDEFVVVLSNTDHEKARRVADQLCTTLARPWHIKGSEYRTTSSIGMAFYPDDGQHVHTLLNRADQALFRAKNAGRACVMVYDPTMR